MCITPHETEVNSVFRFGVSNSVERQNAVWRSVGISWTRERCLRRRKARDRYTEGRARDIVEPDLVAEADGIRIATVLAADPELQRRAGSPTALSRESNKLANP